MKTLLILGAGTAGTMMANRMRKRLTADEWKIMIVDEDPNHYYQSGFLFIPFGIYSPKDVIRPRRHFIPKGVNYVGAEVDCVIAEKNRVLLRSGEHLNYDVLVIATGVKTAPEQTEGMLGSDWGTRVFDFYTFEGVSELRDALRVWNGGRLVVHITEMPIKCPVAPLEFAFLADSWLIDCQLRDKTEIIYVTPRSQAFSNAIAATVLGHLIEKKHIKVATDFHVGRVDNERHKIISWDGKEVDYDLLVTVPTNTGDVAIGRSGLANELNFVATNRQTLQSKHHPNIFVLGDATDLPSSKSSTVAHFQSDVLTETIVYHIKGEQLNSNNELQMVDGKYPLPILGPFSPVRETRLNHFRNLAFRWIYGSCSLEACRLRELALR